MSTAILWFRRDLRLHDHPAMSAALREHEQVIPVFTLDRELLRGRFRSPARSAFMLGCLAELDRELRERGSRLVIRAGRAEQVLPDLAQATGAGAVFWTSDVSAYARTRDARVSEALQAAGIAARPHGGNYIVDVSALRTQAGDPYSVFSPFFRAWAAVPRRPLHAAPRALAPLPHGLDAGVLPGSLRELGLGGEVTSRTPAVAPGEAAARAAAALWLDGRLDGYEHGQDRVGERGTSMLSPYLRWGSLSARELEHRAGGGPGAHAWVRQLAWRDFYAHVLLHWPENLHREFQPRYRALDWDPVGEPLERWQSGQTGYPLVDAGMRELAATGWMHNRARLVVACFLTKDLHQDWRAGERWFERQLLDGEPAQNNGNWQWIASVGTDPAPPFRRMYNPTRQAQRFDPDGTYLRRWLPELEHVAQDRVFEPWRMSAAEQRAAGCRIGRDYPAPIVDHGSERRRALERYRRASDRARDNLRM